jgi:hypothetical protein
MSHCLRFFLTILTVLVMGRTLLGEGAKIDAHLSVRQQADSIVHNLKQNLSLTGADGERLQLLVKSKKEIQTLRHESPLQFRTDETYLNSLVSGLSVLSSKETFNSDNCDSHRAALLSKLAAKAEIRKPASAVLDLLDQICK